MTDNQPSSDPDSPTLRAAADVLRQEQAAPGSQDPDYVRWAAEKLNASQTAVPTPVQPESPQPAVMNEGDETVIQIQQIPGQTIQPTNKPNDGQGAPQ